MLFYRDLPALASTPALPRQVWYCTPLGRDESRFGRPSLPALCRRRGLTQNALKEARERSCSTGYKAFQASRVQELFFALNVWSKVALLPLKR